jgi:hypothetical protein
MKTPIEFAELHGVLFMAGKNHGLKLTSSAALKLEYDEEKKELFVTYKDKTSRIPAPNISSFMEAGQLQRPSHPDPAPAPVNKVKAQVSTPQDHVFAHAPGKTRD